MQVAKRDGRVMEFNKKRIIDAIEKAMKNTPDGVDYELADKIATGIEKQLENREEVSVYEIQDLVEKKLMVSSRKEVATAYITYRYMRDVARKSKTKNIFLDIITSKSSNSQKNVGEYQNINDMMKNFAAESIKPYVDTILLSKDVRDAERHGYIDIRNKSYYPTKAVRTFNIPSIQNKNYLKNCKNIEDAISRVLFLVSKLKGEVCEEVTLPPIDSLFSPFVQITYNEEKKTVEDVLNINCKVSNEAKLLAEFQTKKRVYNSLKMLLENLSVSSIHCSDETSLIGGLIKEAMLHISKEGINITFGEKENVAYRKGVVCAVTLNLPMIALEALNYTKDIKIGDSTEVETNEEETIEFQFFSNLKKCTSLALKSLVERFNFQSTATKGQFPNLMSGLWEESQNLNYDDTIEEVLKNGILELEVFKLSETVVILNGGKSIKEQEKFKEKILSNIDEVINEFIKEYHLVFEVKETNDNKKFGGEFHENS